MAEALLLHLEALGYEGSPRFFGHDAEGRQVLSFMPGDVYAGYRPPWIDDDDERTGLGPTSDVPSRATRGNRRLRTASALRWTASWWRSNAG